MRLSFFSYSLFPLFPLSVKFEGAVGRYEENQSELASLKWQDYPASESGIQQTHACTLWKLKDKTLNVFSLPLCWIFFFNFYFGLTAGRGQRLAACRVRHGGETEEEPHRDDQVNGTFGEFEPWAAGEEPRSRRREGAAGERAPASTEHPGLWTEELQSGLRGDQGAARWHWDITSKTSEICDSSTRLQFQLLITEKASVTIQLKYIFKSPK